MSTDLAVLQNNAVELNKAFGFQGRPKPPIPMLKINGADEEDGKAPKGTLVYDDGERILYAADCTIRTFVKRFQYRLFDAKNPDAKDMSIIFNDFRQELRSTSGRMACGKMGKKAYLDLGDNVSSQQKYYQDNAKCKLLIFGLLSGKFTDVDTKKEVELKDALFSWIVSQSGYMAMDSAIKGIEKERRPVPLTEIKITLKKDKMGSVTFFTPVPEVTANVAPLVAERDAGYLKQINKFINDTNDIVNERFTAATKDKGNNDNFAEVGKNTIDDDTIPF